MKNAKNQREEVNVKKLYGNECLLPKDDLYKTIPHKYTGTFKPRS